MREKDALHCFGRHVICAIFVLVAQCWWQCR